MNKKIPGLLFASFVSIYILVMAFSYTSCNSDTASSTSSTVPTTAGTDSSSTAQADSTGLKTANKKAKKGTASVSIASLKPNNTFKIQKDHSGVYIQPETMPEYPGGNDALSAYIQNNIVYPQQAIDDSKEGTLRVSFVVDEKGNIVDPVVTSNKLGDGIDQEAISVIRKMPKWKPGTVKGKNVKTRLDVPIVFQVSAES
jgi:periplasmic protein TonB